MGSLFVAERSWKCARKERTTCPSKWIEKEVVEFINWSFLQSSRKIFAVFNIISKEGSC